MDTLQPDPGDGYPEIAVASEARRPQLGVYAAASGLASAVPVPWLDDALASLARGAAMRRVARRHGVRLTHEARNRLARPSSVLGASRSPGLRLVRAWARRVLVPLRLAGRVEQAVGALVAAALLDHYLSTAERRPGSAVDGREAERVRAAMDAAVAGSAGEAVRELPGAIGRALVDAVRAAAELDDEARHPFERLADTLLDALADEQGHRLDELVRRFERALATGSADP